jgi:beta-1,4-mannosyl-glycoprotein beta-1,4-N-acetylglucosaminyltransferase
MNHAKKIVDCFIFYNEFDLLTYRMNTLNSVVDYFVIVEATHTFSGKEKPLLFNDNQELFKDFKDKIIHVVVNDVPYKFPNINYEKQEQWENEKHQRNSMQIGLNKIAMNDNDIIIVSDVDEIPDNRILRFIKREDVVIDIYSLEMDFYNYNLHCKVNDKWHKAKIVSFKKFKELSMSFEELRFYNCHKIKNGGWHLSYFGDSHFIKNKIETFSHQEFNTSNFTDIEKIAERVSKYGDLYDRNYKLENIAIKDNTYLPHEYNTYLKKYIGPKHIVFFVRQFSERGTEKSIYDYAHYNETILKNHSYIVCFTEAQQERAGMSKVRLSFDKFKKRFQVFEIENMSEIKNIINKYNIDFFYTQTYGGSNDIYNFQDKSVWGTCKTIKHCIFETDFPEGDFYISISEYLNKKNNTRLPIIPYIVSMPDCANNLREELGIPKDAVVLGRYGGVCQFNIPFVHTDIRRILEEDKDIYFLFMNTAKFCEHPRVIYLEANIDEIYKTKFINTCSAMIHARAMGETFGLAIAEFSIMNKPIITCSCGDLEHLLILKEKAIVYNSEESLMKILKHIREILTLHTNWNCYSYFSPENIMGIFDNTIFRKMV